MRSTQYPLHLTGEERSALRTFVSQGKHSAKAIRRAYILLEADEDRPGGPLKEFEIAQHLQVHPNTIYKVRKTYAELGWEATVQRKKRITPPNPPKITGEVEAKIIALSCSTPPAGRSTWSLSLLAQKAVELHYIDSISHETVRHVLKKRT